MDLTLAITHSPEIRRATLTEIRQIQARANPGRAGRPFWVSLARAVSISIWLDFESSEFLTYLREGTMGYIRYLGYLARSQIYVFPQDRI